jgi:hypothetical protein
MWPDNDTVDDLIGFQVHADLVRAVVLNQSLLPVTVGVFGDWGGGKTSIMRMLERSLRPESWPAGSAQRLECEKVAVVYVNTWQFEGYDDAKAAILSSVLLQLQEHERFGATVRKRALKLLKAVNAMRFIRLSLKHVALPAAAAAFTGGTAAIPAALIASIGLGQLMSAAPADAQKSTDRLSLEDIGGIWKGLAEDEAIDVRTFQKEFAALLKDAGIHTLVVLIDDLDRCTPERIVENLEAVKLFLSVPHTAFVIGADRRIVEHAIRSRYARPAQTDSQDPRRASEMEAEDRLVRDYLEKVVQVPYSLPRLSAAEIETYMTLLFCMMHLSADKAQLCATSSENLRRANRYRSFGYGDVKAALADEVPQPLASHLTVAIAAAPLMADGLKGNPRQVKRFLNALLLRKELARVAGLEQAVRTDVLVKLMILEYVEPDLFLDLFKELGPSDGRVSLLASLENYGASATKKGKEPEEVLKGVLPQWKSTWAKRWLEMQPPLAVTDLRDYFWVARDRLASTFSGITMVPPAVRAVFADFTSGLAPRRHTAVKTAKTLTADERAALYRFIEQEIVNQPSDPKSYEPLRALAEADVDGAAAALAHVLTSYPPSDMPAAVGMWVVNLSNSKPHYQPLLTPVVEQLRTTETAIGKAMKAGKRS